MKRVLAIVFLAIILFGAWWLFFKTDKPSGESGEEDLKAIVVKKHSDSFNNSISNVITSYLAMKSSFVDGDTVNIKLNASNFISEVDSLNLEELRANDEQIINVAQQQISDIKANASPILQETDLTAMRQDFRMVSENMYPFLKTIGYEGEKLYWQNCPMAFDDQEANWLSNTSEIINPYLGKNHPTYKSSMLHCGENKDSIFIKTSN